MKHILYIIGFIVATLFFYDNKDLKDSLSDLNSISETIMEETYEKNREQCLVILSEDLKNCDLQTPRRVVQYTSPHYSVRSITQSEKQIQYFKLKGCDLLSKLSEESATDHYNNYTALWRNKGLHVFALRKLLI